MYKYVCIYITISVSVCVCVCVCIYILICMYAPPLLGDGYSFPVHYHGGMGGRAVRAERRG